MKRFERVYVEISDYCGLNCGFCPSSSRNISRGQMDLELFRRVCSQISHKARRVCLHLLGDPLSVDSLSDYLLIARDFGLKLEIVSSGLFLSKHSFESLLSAPIVQVCFSLSAMIANLKRFNKSHLAQILAFCDKAIQQKNDNAIFVNLRIQNIYLDSMDAMLCDIARHFQCDFSALKATLLMGQKVRLAKKILLVPMRQFQWRVNMANPQKNRVKHCLATKKQIGILSDGTLVPCCMDYAGEARFGNVAYEALDTLLDSKAFRDFSMALENGLNAHKICQSCGFH